MALVDIYVDLEAEGYQYVFATLGKLSKQARIAVRRAVNETAKDAKKQDDRLTKRTYTAKGDIHALKMTRASVGNLTAILRDSGSNISMTHFNHYAGKGRVSAVINRTHGRRTLGKYGNPAFFGKIGHGKNTGTGIAVRLGKSRTPIEKMASISSPVMHGNDGTWGTIEPEVRQMLHENVEKELERILG